MGGVRAQFATAVNIRMSLYSIPIFAAFEEITGHPSEYKSHGYLFVATTPQHLEYLRRNYERQTALGLRQVEMLGREEIVHRVPQLRSDDILGGSFCATDGFVDPYSVMKGFMAAAAEQGARLWRSVEVTGIDVDARGVAGVRTRDGTWLRARWSTPPVRGPRRSRAWRASISPSCHCAACWSPPSHFPACRIDCPWSSICPPDSISARKAWAC